MFDSRGSGVDRGLPERGVALIGAGIDALLKADLTQLDDRQLVRHLSDLETQARRLPAVLHQVVAALQERKVARRRGLRDTAALLRRELHVGGGEAKARVQAAAALAGEAGPAALPVAAAAQREGRLSPAHVRVIAQAVEELPIALRATKAAELEAILVAEARELDPYRLAQRARQLLADLDPDRIRRQDREHQRRRSAHLVRNPLGRPYRSRTTSDSGRLQHSSTSPGSGAVSGAGE